MSDKQETVTQGEMWIWHQRAGADELELLDDSEHFLYVGEPTECTPGLLSGPVAQICSISDMEDANDDDGVRLSNAEYIKFMWNAGKRLAAHLGVDPLDLARNIESGLVEVIQRAQEVLRNDLYRRGKATGDEHPAFQERKLSEAIAGLQEPSDAVQA